MCCTTPFKVKVDHLILRGGGGYPFLGKQIGPENRVENMLDLIGKKNILALTLKISDSARQLFALRARMGQGETKNRRTKRLT